MKGLNNTDSLLKRFLKRKVKITESLIVGFLITGGIAFASPNSNLFLEELVSTRNIYEEGRVATNGSKVENEEDEVINNTVEGPGLMALGIHSEAINKGLIENNGNYGIKVENGGVGINKGGNFSYATIGRDEEIKNLGIKNTGDYGMAAYANHDKLNEKYPEYYPAHPKMEARPSSSLHQESYAAIENEGLVANNGSYGMYVEADGTFNHLAPTGNGNEYGPAVAIGENRGGTSTITYTEKENEKSKSPHNGQYSQANGVKNTGDYGMVAVAKDRALAVQKNSGLVANGGDYGMYAEAISEEGPAVAVVTNYGGTGNQKKSQNSINTGADRYNNENKNIEIEIEMENGVLNTGNYGMSVVADGENAIAFAGNLFSFGAKRNRENSIKPQEIAPINMGLIANDGDYGMTVLAKNGGTAIGLNAGFDLDYDLSMQDRKTFYSRQPVSIVDKEITGSLIGGVQNTGNYGMVAKTDGEAGSLAIAANIGLVANGGDHGMVADGENAWAVNAGGNVDVAITVGEKYENPNPSTRSGLNQLPYLNLALAATSGVQNAGDYGMVAMNGGKALNFGLVANGRDYGIVADGEDSYGLNTGRDFSIEGELTKIIEVGPNLLNGGNGNLESEEYNLFKGSLAVKGGVKNDGNFGMVATNGGTVVNTGAVANNGDYGMVATGEDSYALNHPSIIENIFKIHSNTEEGNIEINIPSDEAQTFEPDGIKFKLMASLEESGVKNKGNYGMLADNKGVTINAGLVKNTGDVGMGVLNNSYGINQGRDLTGIDLLNITYAEINKYFSQVPASKATLENLGVHQEAIEFLFCNDEYKDFESWITDKYGEENSDEVAEILAKYGKLATKGGILNEGNIGAYVAGNSVFENHGVINPGGTTLSTVGKNLLAASGIDPNTPDKIAILGGAGDNLIVLGTGSQITGRVNGGLGDNALHFVDTYDEHTKELIENKEYGKIDNYSFTHMLFGKNTTLNKDGDKITDADGNTVFDQGDSASSTDWKVSQKIALNPHMATNKTDYAANENGVITTDKFNGIYMNGEFIERDHPNHDELFKGNVEFTENGGLLKHVGRNMTSTLAANSISMNKGSKITQRALDNLFVTNANRIEITNIFTNGKSEELTRAIGQNGLVVDGEKAQSGALSDEFFSAESITGGTINGWNTTHQYDATTGDVTLVFERAGGHGLQGGYADSIDRYTQSDVDIINGMNIREQGYSYARKAAFMSGSKVVTTEEVIYPVAIPDKSTPVKTGKEVVQAPVVEVVEVVNEVAYNNLQFAEVFGDFGKYNGSSSSEYDYDTWGVTGATFHRFNDNWLAGLSYGYAGSKVDYNTNEGGKDNIDSLGINGVVSYQKDNWLLSGNLGYSWSRHDLTRKVYDRDYEILGTSPVQSMSADFDSHFVSLGAELGYNYVIGETSSLYPYAGLDYIWYARDSYKEDGTEYALDIDKTDLNTVVSKLGLLYEKSWDKIGIFGDIGWQHYFDDPNSFDATFYKTTSATYEIPGLDIGKDIGYVKVGVTYDFNEQLTAGIDYTGAFKNNETSNRVGVNVQYKW
ncbi:autotransporter outer membrane beta-barrel domain-containing protein [Cetobacterium somerae]|uniref:autotransporter outer membrane beta-barrel domain-containing protein n=1 Tax=Cetobacterium somerae TaxID=188913 RepID=UPI002E7BCE17|nr:autotransporter outer membrane beta-barrel domain-containing protein [Cetobacterium somerae]WVJ00588.1 autotransporter outer membrane beta-barrel domain-containing protein [Cetobacterium somerae]